MMQKITKFFFYKKNNNAFDFTLTFDFSVHF